VHERREVRLEANVRGAAFVFALAGSALACNTPSTAHDPRGRPPVPEAPLAEREDAGQAANAGDARGQAPPATSGACASDDDCRTVSSYCAEAPCACRVVSARQPEPRCLGAAASNVRCFADPCMNKAARCQSGACVLTAR
jgi:hypothetical protein